MAITITLTEQDAFDYLASRVHSDGYSRPTIAKADLPETGATLPNDPTAVARSIAAADPLPIAPVVGTATLDPQAAFAPPAPSPAPAAPTAAVPAPPAPPAPPVIVPVVPKLDKNGFPWDQRIHSSSKGINEDGTWRAKRGVDKELVKTVEAELKQLMGIQLPPQLTAAQLIQQVPLPPIVSAPATPAPPVSAPATTEVPPPPVVSSPATTEVPPPPPAAAPSDVLAPPPTTAPSPTVAAASGMTFAGLIAAVMPRIAAGVLTQDQVNKVLGEFSIPALPLLASRPDMIPAVALALGL